MKTRGNGRAKILNPAELKQLFVELRKKPRDACLFAICLFTACRISEALQLETSDIRLDEQVITFRKSTTKGKLKTRTLAIHPNLVEFLEAYRPKRTIMFPGQTGRGNTYMSRNTADRILRNACKRAGIVGCSTHSFRRTALTHMNRANQPLRNIQEISGHADLGTLQRYLEVSPEDIARAIATITL